MKKQDQFLNTLLCLLLVLFTLGRVAFLAYNSHVGEFTFSQALSVCWTGFVQHDLYFSVLLLAFPWLLTLLATRFNGIPLRAILMPYYIALGFVLSVVITADIVMYEYWQFKLNAVILSYAAHPEGVANSESLLSIILRVLPVPLLTLLVAVAGYKLTPKRIAPIAGSIRFIRMTSIIWAFFLVVALFFTRVGDTYRTDQNIFLNHASINPVYGFCTTVYFDKDFSHRHNYLDEAERNEVFNGLYPQDLDDISDTLLRTSRPNVLVVLLESFGGTYTGPLGGISATSPQLERLIPEGVFWDNFYCNSFRTDRGVASVMNGSVAYPEVSLMTDTRMHAQLPSLAKTFKANGYTTNYLYAGPMTNMGKRTYLENLKVQNLIDYTAFKPEELTSTWGADDSISAMRVVSILNEKTARKEPTFLFYQTLSSHEPWIVPSRRLEDNKLNAFAYTDACMGMMIDSLRNSPAWDNLLVILLPDHGNFHQQDFTNPLFFHGPMLWIGGAVKEPRRMPQLMNQNDVAATLFAQMGIDHSDFSWSRNVLSSKYTYPFAYCNYPGGMLWVDETGSTLYDIHADFVLVKGDGDSQARIQNAKAVLQTSHDKLNNLVVEE